MAQTSIFTTQLSLRKTKISSFNPAEHQAVLGGLLTVENGLLAGQCDIAYSAQAVSIAASGTLNLDLNGVLTDDLAQAFNAVRICGMMVTAADANVNDLIIGNAASNGFVGPFGAIAHTMAVRPGGTFVNLATKGAAPGWVVTPGTGDILKLLNGGASTPAVFDIALIGRSA